MNGVRTGKCLRQVEHINVSKKSNIYMVINVIILNSLIIIDVDKKLNLIEESFLSKLSAFLVYSLSILRVPDECYSRNASCAMNLISTFLLLSLGRNLCFGVPENIIRPVVSASKLTWSIRYIHY